MSDKAEKLQEAIGLIKDEYVEEAHAGEAVAEIAEQEGISRQGVHDAIRRGARQLEAYEEQLGLAARYQRLTEGLREGLRVLEAAPGEQAQQARDILATLLSQEEE